ncbi:MAG TPA: ATP-binding protein [Moraxellaceae bacterium]|nr:ATP-binding protein [Moraxellaceae bacterium]
MLYLVTALACLQAIVIFFLLRNRKRRKQTLESLRETHALLEQRLASRTESWRQATDTLEQTEQRHRVTTALLNETKEYLNSIINSMPSIMIGVTPSGHITHWNSAAELATGIREKQALGFRLHEIYPDLPVSAAMIDEAIANSEPSTRENVKIEHLNTVRYVDITVYPLHSLELTGAVIRVDDVTLRQKLDSMMLQNEKLKSLGELAAGMAHEINNPLAAILQSLQNVQRRLNPDQPGNQAAARALDLDLRLMQDYLEARDINRFLSGMESAGHRAAEIVRHMLEFSRSSSRQLEPTSLNAIAHASVEFMRNAIELSMPALHARLVIEEDFDIAMPAVPASGVELQQVLVNLLKNAAQAIQEAHREQPRIQISTRLVPPFAEIRVEDNGVGMNLSTSRQIFDPFFTTKAVGQGTGLGLSISHFIISQRHHGRIEVSSTPGVGTTFILSLPLQQPTQPGASQA